MHDFAIPELGKAVPYGIYDVSANAGFVNMGISADTGEFSVASIRRWWYAVGAPRYPDARKILINADCGGSNGARLRLWKRELQVLADELRIEITVCHVPPGTSKWNKIEHRLFSFITQNWRGKPLISYLVIVQLIASTTTDSGLTVACQLDENDYAKGTKVTDAEMAALNIQPAVFHGEWNYTIAPRRPDGRRGYSGSGPKLRFSMSMSTRCRKATFESLPRLRDRCSLTRSQSQRTHRTSAVAASSQAHENLPRNQFPIAPLQRP